jgi:hypothetical protein
VVEVDREGVDIRLVVDMHLVVMVDMGGVDIHFEVVRILSHLAGILLEPVVALSYSTQQRSFCWMGYGNVVDVGENRLDLVCQQIIQTIIRGNGKAD